jgi:hypothetical protein
LQIYAQLFGFAKYFAIFFKEKIRGSLNPITTGSQGVAVHDIRYTLQKNVTPENQYIDVIDLVPACRQAGCR